MPAPEEADVLHRAGVGVPGNPPVVDVNAVVGGMEANGVNTAISRTCLRKPTTHPADPANTDRQPNDPAVVRRRVAW